LFLGFSTDGPQPGSAPDPTGGLDVFTLISMLDTLSVSPMLEHRGVDSVKRRTCFITSADADKVCCLWEILAFRRLFAFLSSTFLSLLFVFLIACADVRHCAPRGAGAAPGRDADQAVAQAARRDRTHGTQHPGMPLSLSLWKAIIGVQD
jgi:hypothetical protein